MKRKIIADSKWHTKLKKKIIEERNLLDCNVPWCWWEMPQSLVVKAVNVHCCMLIYNDNIPKCSWLLKEIRLVWRLSTWLSPPWPFVSTQMSVGSWAENSMTLVRHANRIIVYNLCDCVCVWVIVWVVVWECGELLNFWLALFVCAHTYAC